MQLNGRGGHTTENEYGAWTWEAGAGEAIVSATIKAKLRNFGGWSAQLFALKPNGTAFVFGTAPANGDFDVYNFFENQVGVSGAGQVDAQLKCYRSGGCDLDAIGGATNRPDNIQLTVRDSQPPNIDAAGRFLAGDPSRWHEGVEVVSLDGHDSGSGLTGWAVSVDSQPLRMIGEVACLGDRGSYAVTLQPCPSAASASVPLNTAVIGDGVHQVGLCAGDYGLPQPNYGCSPPQTIKVDNTAPLQPENLEVAGGQQAWHADNSFDLSWVNPPQSAAPIMAVHHRILDSSGSVVSGDARTTGDLGGLSGIAVPSGPGRYTVEVSLEDGAGNQGAPARAELRFDNVRPGRSDPSPPPGWLSRTEIPFTQQLGHPESPLPVSGIRGYAVAVDQSPSADPCAAADRCSDSETDIRDGVDGDTFEIADLPEGTSWVHSVAVSGSGMRSALVGRAGIRVDKTDPVTGLSGAPSGWTNQAVAITATATDALSGMAPDGGDGDPFAAIRIDGGPPTSSIGDSVSTAITGDGVHSVSYYARDLAGNVNDGGSASGRPNRPPGTALIRIDRTSPGIAFLNSQDPNDPEVVRAQISDSLSGPDSTGGSILIRKVGSTKPFEQLPTDADDGTIRARWNSDSYPAGEYEFRAVGSDIAGNLAATGRRANGSDMVLPNPLKVPTALRAGFGGKVLTQRRCTGRGARRHCHRKAVPGFNQRPRVRTVEYGAGTRFSGRLSAGLGSALSGMAIKVIERFDPGARRERRVTTVKTDHGGIFSIALRPGPSRTIGARFAGSRTLTRSSARSARMRVRGGVTLNVSSKVAVIGGRPLVFSGRVGARGALIPADGKVVQLQYRLPGVPWTEFRTIPANRRSGHYRLDYRFSDPQSRGVRFAFRAYAPAQNRWPFLAAGSAPVAVRGR